MTTSDAVLPAAALSSPSPRLLSLDALRGFDMFWIIGGADLARAAAEKIPNPVVEAISENQTEPWSGRDSTSTT
jgi:hypothetical protein